MSSFSDYVTSVGFRLELSKAQLRYLSAVILAQDSDMLVVSEGGLSERALINKGLLTYRNGQPDAVLTEEGKLLAPLLRRAGLLDATVIRHRATARDIERSMKE